MNGYLTHKLQHTSLYQTTFPDGYVVWKPLPFVKYRRYREALNNIGAPIYLEVEEMVYDECVVFSSYDPILDPEDEESPGEGILFRDYMRGEQHAGIMATVVKTIMHLSGVKTVQGKNYAEAAAQQAEEIAHQFDIARSYALSDLEEQLVIAVCKAFPSYKPEEVEQLEWSVLLKRAAQAEQILGTRFEIRKKEERKEQKIDMEADRKEWAKTMRGHQMEDDAPDGRRDMAARRNERLRRGGMG